MKTGEHTKMCHSSRVRLYHVWASLVLELSHCVLHAFRAGRYWERL